MKNPNMEMIIREIRIPKWVDDYFTTRAIVWKKPIEKYISDFLEEQADYMSMLTNDKDVAFWL